MQRTLKIFAAVLLCASGLVFVAGVAARFYLTDERLKSMTEDQLNRNFSGHFQVTSVRWRLPLNVDVEGVAVQSPQGLPVMKLSSLHADLKPLPLLRGAVIFHRVSVNQFTLDLPFGQRGTLPLAQALEPTKQQPEKAPEDKKMPVRIQFDSLQIDNAAIDVRSRDWRARVKRLELVDGYVWLGGDAMGTTASVKCDVMLSMGNTDMPLPQVVVQVEEAAYHFASETPHAEFERLTMRTPGLELLGGGDVQLAEGGVQNANAWLRVAVDTEEPTLRLNLPGDLSTHLRGKANLNLAVHTTGDTHRLTARLGEQRFEIYGMPVKVLNVDASLTGQKFNLQGMLLQLAQGELEISGAANLATSPRLAVGQHAVTVTLRNFPVRALAGQLVGLPALLPEGVSLTARSSGRALFPPTSEVVVDVMPSGLPGGNWPGLPHSMEIRGRFLTHPDLLEVLKLEVKGDNVPSFAIQGGLPMTEQSIIDLIQEIHSAHPEGPLKRIPAAPASAVRQG